MRRARETDSGAATAGPTDSEVVETSLHQPQAFALLFDRHFDALHAYVQRRVGTNLGEEIAAEAFVRAFDERARYDGRYADARPWLFGIAANLLRRHWRSERRRFKAYARAAGDAGTRDAPPLSGDVLAKLRRLRRGEREALLLFAWADLTYDEIAVALQIPTGTVRSRIARARTRLRAELAASRPTEPFASNPREVSDG